MATINIKYSQAVIDQEHGTQTGTPRNGSIGTLLDVMFSANYNVNKSYQYYSSWSWNGSTLILNFPDGATKTYTGVVRADPNALQGSATATRYEFLKNGTLTTSETGLLHLDYQLVAVGTGYAMSLGEGSAPSYESALALTTLIPSSSASYDKTLGNISVLVDGAVYSEPSGKISGTVSRLTTTADKYIVSNVLEGSFNVTGNSLTAGQGLSTTSATGTLTGFKQDYRDGSHAYITGLSTYLSADQTLDTRILAEGSRYAGNDTIDIDLPVHLYSDFVMASGSGNDTISVKGGGGHLNVDAGSGDDRITVLSDTHRIDGGAGLDTVVLPSGRSGYTLSKSADGFALTDSAGAVNTLINIERLTFSDTSFALDVAGNGGKAYRVYQAAFDRVPDLDGLGFWIKYMDAGMSLTEVAGGFMASPEFKAMYGLNPSHENFVNKLYQNVLHRPGEADGVAFWLKALANPDVTYAGVLAAFSESNENQVGLIGVIGNGFAYHASA